MRNLAGLSAAAAGGIADLINEIRNDSKQSVNLMGKVRQEVQKGIEVANETRHNFLMILERMQPVTHQLQEMSAATQQISAGFQQVTGSIVTIAQISREASENTHRVADSSTDQLALMQEITSSCNVLSSMAVNLQALTGRFQVQLPSLAAASDIGTGK